MWERAIGLSDGYLDGLIDDFRIYNRALSATEVSNLHQLPNFRCGRGWVYLCGGIGGWHQSKFQFE